MYILPPLRLAAPFDECVDHRFFETNDRHFPAPDIDVFEHAIINVAVDLVFRHAEPARGLLVNRLSIDANYKVAR